MDYARLVMAANAGKWNATKMQRVSDHPDKSHVDKLREANHKNLEKAGYRYLGVKDHRGWSHTHGYYHPQKGLAHQDQTETINYERKKVHGLSTGYSSHKHMDAAAKMFGKHVNIARWWDKLTPDEKAHYKKIHPGSKIK